MLIKTQAMLEKAKNEINFMQRSDKYRVVEEPTKILNSMIFSVLLESEKAKAYADLKIKASKEQVLKSYTSHFER